ncbi:MAG: DUF262 domain-containing protein [Thermoleophilia bacterium]
MKPDTRTVSDLFERDIRYVVPLFQRPYVWDRESQWEPLWDDVLALLEHQIDGGGPAPSHFLGAIVLEQEPTGPGDLPVFTVIDGQQRLTTLQLLLSAATAALREADYGNDAILLAEFTRNNPNRASGDEIFKAWPTNANRPAFRAVMAEDGPPSDRVDDPDNQIDEAYAFFRDRASSWLAENASSVDQPGRLLGVTLAHLLRLVSITLEPGENAQAIFETLNARGTPLLALDLMKNAVFHDAGREGLDVEALYEARWRSELDADHWRKVILHGRLRRPRGELFLMHWLAMKLERVIPATELFNVFRREVLDAPREGSVQVLIDELCDDAAVFRSFDAKDRTAPEGRFFERLAILDTTTVLPVALLLFRTKSITAPRRRRALAAIESWLMRRALLRYTSRPYNREVPRLLSRISADPDRADEAVVAHLRDVEGQSAHWPRDEELVGFLSEQTVYGLVAQRRLVLALSAVEEALHDSRTEVLEYGGLSLEHVMPQSWQANWPIPPAAPADANTQRVAHINRLGNLTLVRANLNSALSNAAWAGKQEDLATHSRLLLNLDLVQRYGEGFDEDAIDERSRWLAEAISTIWPGPDSAVWDSSHEVPPPKVGRLGPAGEALPNMIPTTDGAAHLAPAVDTPPAEPPAQSEGVEIAIVRARHEEGLSRGQTASRLRVTEADVEQTLWVWEPIVYPSLRLEATVEDVVAAREGTLPAGRLIPGEHPRLRWERIAERAGVSPAQARELYEAGRGVGSAARSYTGLGRKFDGMD